MRLHSMNNTWILYLFILTTCNVSAITTFINLDFEEGRRDLPAGDVLTQDILPGWKAYYGSELQEQIVFEDHSLTTTSIEMRNRASLGEGRYGLGLQHGDSLWNFKPPRIVQHGQIAEGSPTLELFGILADDFELIEIMIDGERLELFMLEREIFNGGERLWDVVAADVTRFVGREIELSVGMVPQENLRDPNGFYLDAIAFTNRDLSSIIPEPESGIYLAISLLLLGHHRRRCMAGSIRR